MEVYDSAKLLLVNNMGVKQGENVLVITDDEKFKIGEALYKAAKDLNANSTLMVIPMSEHSGSEPLKSASQAMKFSDVVICPTVHSLTHTNARIEAVKNGARIATMPNISEAMFSEGAVTADYGKVEKLTYILTEKLTKANSARILKDEHILELSIAGRKGVPSTGIYKEPGEGGNLPSGEAYIAPIENTARGSMKIDGSMVGIGKLKSPLIMTIKNGCIEKIEGEDKEKLDILLQNKNNGTLCELGIGTNDKAILCGVILEDEKVYGTVHIAFGTNTSFGGKVKADCHMDGIILNPTLYLDDELIIEKGVFKI